MESMAEQAAADALRRHDHQAYRDAAEQSLASMEYDPLILALKRVGVPRSRQHDLGWLDLHLAADYLDHPEMPEALRLLREIVPFTLRPQFQTIEGAEAWLATTS